MLLVPPLVGRPQDVSLDGHHVDTHFDFAAIAVTVLFVVMIAIIAIALVYHRESKGARAVYDHGSSKKATWGIVGVCLAIFFVVDGALLVLSFADLNGRFWNWPTDPRTVRVEVYGQQWGWNFRYPGADGKFGTRDDIVTFNNLHIPANRPVMVRMQSSDVIHSFYLPNFRIKQDVVPGMTTQLWFQAKETGVFDIGCAQHCGANHYKMHATLTIDDEAGYGQWESAAGLDAERRFDDTDVAAHWAWEWK